MIKLYKQQWEMESRKMVYNYLIYFMNLLKKKKKKKKNKEGKRKKKK